MLNLGLSELAIIAIVAILVIGPKELPVVMAHAGRLFKRISYMRFAASQHIDHFVQKSGLEDLQNHVNFEDNPFAEIYDDQSSDSAQKYPADTHKKAVKSAKENAKTTTKKAPAKKKATRTKTASKKPKTTTKDKA